MQKFRYSEERMASILKKGQSGVPVTRVCCENEISVGTYYKWRKMFREKEQSLPAPSSADAKKIQEELKQKHDRHSVKDKVSEVPAEAKQPTAPPAEIAPKKRTQTKKQPPTLHPQAAAN